MPIKLSGLATELNEIFPTFLFCSLRYFYLCFSNLTVNMNHGGVLLMKTERLNSAINDSARQSATVMHSLLGQCSWPMDYNWEGQEFIMC